jgi:hypothetical protein
MTTYSDLTSSELLYLANRGHADAADCLRNRAMRGDPEAVHYLTAGVGEDYVAPAGAQSADQMFSPERLLSAAINAASAKVANRINQAVNPPRPPMVRGPARRPTIVRPPSPARVLPKWGVFVDFMQEPMEVFDTMRAANEWAKTVPQGLPVAVVRSGQEPPRAPMGYVSMLNPPGQDEMPYVSAYEQAQSIASGPAPRSAYEQYQLAQGQGF